MRMLRGHRGTELGGITDRTVIPECFGMYGINESGQMDMVYHSKSPRYPEPSIPPDNDHVRKLPEAHLGRIKQEVDVEPHQHDVVIPIGTTLKAPTTETLGPLPCEEGGVQVLRPLLSFSKERLQATCLADGMPWFEDLTNIDPTITQRNAIRHIYANYSLPVALQKPAILSLSQAWTLRGASYEAAATNHLASETQITSFDPRCGSITLRFAFLPDTRVTAESPVRWPFKQQQIAIRLLRTTIEAVSPEPHIKLDRLRRVQRTVFPHLFEPDPFSSERSLSFTVAGVRIERSDWIKKKSKSISCEDADDIHRDHHFNHEWRITREPHRGSVNRVQLTIPAGTLPQWNLYDGRYWIRLCNRTSTSTLRVRPFCTGDSGSFRRKFSSKEQIRLGLLLKTLVPGDLRWTLPAIVMSDDHGIDQVLSLPTLGFDAPGMETFLSYEIRYKKVHPKICVHAAENLCSTCV